MGFLADQFREQISVQDDRRMEESPDRQIRVRDCFRCRGWR